MPVTPGVRVRAGGGRSRGTQGIPCGAGPDLVALDRVIPTPQVFDEAGV